MFWARRLHRVSQTCLRMAASPDELDFAMVVFRMESTMFSTKAAATLAVPSQTLGDGGNSHATQPPAARSDVAVPGEGEDAAIFNSIVKLLENASTPFNVTQHAPVRTSEEVCTTAVVCILVLNAFCLKPAQLD